MIRKQNLRITEINREYLEKLIVTNYQADWFLLLHLAEFDSHRDIPPYPLQSCSWILHHHQKHQVDFQLMVYLEKFDDYFADGPKDL